MSSYASDGRMAHVQLNNVWVPQQLKIFNFALDTAGHVSADELFSRDDLESNLLASALMNGQPHFPERTFA